jgi:hypothetical protein
MERNFLTVFLYFSGATMNKSLIIFFLACASSAQAATETRLEVPVTYHPNAGVVEHVKNKCQIEDMLQTRVGAVLRRLNGTGSGIVESNEDPAGDQVLRLKITHVLGVGGGAWSGPKGITLSAELLEGDKVVRHTKINRWSVGGMFGTFKGTCEILALSADAISKDLSRWVRNPGYRVVEENAPKEHEAPTAEPGGGNNTDAEAPVVQTPETLPVDDN